jgi:hypothetical protein
VNLAPNAAIARLFQERFPGRQLPEAPDAIRAALLESEPASPTAASGLGLQRVEAVRQLLTKAGVDSGRLRETAVAEAPEGVEGQLTLDLVEAPESPQRPGTQPPGFGSRGGTAPRPVGD